MDIHEKACWIVEELIPPLTPETRIEAVEAELNGMFEEGYQRRPFDFAKEELRRRLEVAERQLAAAQLDKDGAAIQYAQDQRHGLGRAIAIGGKVGPPDVSIGEGSCVKPAPPSRPDAIIVNITADVASCVTALLEAQARVDKLGAWKPPRRGWLRRLDDWLERLWLRVL